MADEKKCPYCKKKLRADNTRGACSECLKSGKPVPEGAGDELAGLTKLAPVTKTSKAKSDTLKRFRIVAEAMGLDADKMLEEYAAGWLELVKEKVTEAAGA